MTDQSRNRAATLPAPPLPDAQCCVFTVHAVLPPPITGMTLCTQSVADAMSTLVPVRSYNWSNGAPHITMWFRIVKAVRAMLTPWKLLLSKRPEHAVFYMPANAGVALYYNLIAFAVARLRGYRCVAHHHMYTYSERPDWRIAVLDRLLGPRGMHAVLCPDMEQRLRRFYACRTPMAIVPSTIQLLSADVPRIGEHDAAHTSAEPFRIGLISNLLMIKGLDEAVEVLRALRRQQRNVQLVIAGPIRSKMEQSLIDSARDEFGTAFDFRGQVYNEDKRRFYRDIHVKLFPTRYADGQPLVISEAFAYSRPVISYGRGCIPSMLGPQTQWAIPTCADFVTNAVRQISFWIDDPAAYAEARQLARQRYEALLEDAVLALENFGRWVRCEPVDGA